MRPIILLLALALPWTVQAQDDNKSSNLERVEVVGSRISYRDLQEIPAITITRKGDYLLQEITLLNDTRNEEGRKQEIHATIEKMIAQAGGRYEILHGDEYRVVLDRSSFHVDLEADGKRPDASKVTLYVKAPVSGDPASGDASIQSLRAFVKSAGKIGRTEIDLPSDTAIGMNKPEKYRHDLIGAIAEDSRQVGGELGSGCKVELGGLNSRIEWQRVSAVELLLYISYTMKITDCSASAGKN